MESKHNELFEWLGTKRRPRRSRKIEQEWTPNDVRLLIQLVQQRELLWDPSKVSHKDTKLREHSFQVIAEALNRTMADCKAKWDNLRAQYRSYQAKACQNMSIKWQYFEPLSFLNQVCEPRKIKGNMTHLDMDASNDTMSMKAPYPQSQGHFMEDLDSCSSLFSKCTQRSANDDMSKMQDPNDINALNKSRTTLEHIHNSAQIFGDFVADQMRQLKPHLADELKKNILKLVVESLEKNK